jgi:ABC-type spermidine/putrescine transport system permease subunit I
VVFTMNMTSYAAPEILGAGTKPFVANALENIFFFQSNPYLGSAAGIGVLAIVTVVVVLLVGVGMRGSRIQ